jgi:hypothetical protein
MPAAGQRQYSLSRPYSPPKSYTPEESSHRGLSKGELKHKARASADNSDIAEPRKPSLTMISKAVEHFSRMAGSRFALRTISASM